MVVEEFAAVSGLIDEFHVLLYDSFDFLVRHLVPAVPYESLGPSFGVGNFSGDAPALFVHVVDDVIVVDFPVERDVFVRQEFRPKKIL